jgi:outer membrane protein
MRPIFICCVALALAAPARADTLWQAWQLARANDPAFAAAGAQLRAAATAEPAALAALLPQFTLGASAGPQNQHLAAPEFYGSGFEPVTQTQKLGVSTWQATITQPLFDWTALKTYQASRYAVQAAAANYQASLEALTVALATAYVTDAQAAADLVSFRSAERGFAQQYQNAEARYRAGLTGIINADEAQAADRSLQVQVAQAQETLIAADQALAALTGSQGEAVDPLPNELPLPPLSGLDVWIAQARRGNPVIAAARAATLDDASLAEAAKGGFLPDVALQLQHAASEQGGSAGDTFQGQTISGPGNLLQQDNAVTVQFTWNVFSGGATRSAVDQAEAISDQASDDAATAQIGVMQAIHTNYQALTIDKANLAAAEAASEAAAAAVDAANQAVLSGLLSESDLINDRQQLLSAQLALHAAVTAAISHELALAQAAGSATPDFIQTLSAVLTSEETPPHDRKNHS